MPNHPNRSRAYNAPGRTPRPDEIRDAREAAGLSQPEAARLIFCTPNGWIEWESGNRRMHPAFWELFRLKVRGQGMPEDQGDISHDD